MYDQTLDSWTALEFFHHPVSWIPAGWEGSLSTSGSLSVWVRLYEKQYELKALSGDSTQSRQQLRIQLKNNSANSETLGFII